MACFDDWSESLFRRSLATIVAVPPTDGNAISRFIAYWTEVLDDAEASGAVTGVERDVLASELQAAVRALPGVTVVEFSSSTFLSVPFTTEPE